MDDKIELTLTIQEFNLVMKQLAAGQLGECIDLFMRLRQVGMEYQQKGMRPPVAAVPKETPKAA